MSVRPRQRESQAARSGLIRPSSLTLLLLSLTAPPLLSSDLVSGWSVAREASQSDDLFNTGAGHLLSGGRAIAAPATPPDPRARRAERRWVEWVPLGPGALPARRGPRGGSALGRIQLAPFSLSRGELTLGLWRACRRARVCGPLAGGAGCSGDESADRRVSDEQPLRCLSWAQARRVARWLAARLPTPDEWRFASSGGRGWRFPWGRRPANCERATFRRRGAGCGRGVPTPPCAKRAGDSPQGVCDLAGNLREWGTPLAGAALENPSQVWIYGGGYLDLGVALKSDRVSAMAPHRGASDLGVRLARDR